MTHFAVHGHSIHAHRTLYTQATSECARSTRRERRLFLFSRLFCSRLFSISLPQLVRIDKLEELAPDLIVLERLPMAEHQKPAYTGGGGGRTAGDIRGQSAVFATRTQTTKPTHMACDKWWDTQQMRCDKMGIHGTNETDTHRVRQMVGHNNWGVTNGND